MSNVVANIICNPKFLLRKIIDYLNLILYILKNF